jgi:hypothetical protein
VEIQSLMRPSLSGPELETAQYESTLRDLVQCVPGSDCGVRRITTPLSQLSNVYDAAKGPICTTYQLPQRSSNVVLHAVEACAHASLSKSSHQLGTQR